MTFKPTAQQQAFIDALLNTTDHITLRARAGCGKTSAILMGVDALTRQNPQLEIVVCAFNKAIADEVKEKLKQRGPTDWRKVQACTLHSLGLGLLKFMFKPKVEPNKIRDLIRAQNDPFYEEYGAQIAELVRYAKQAGVGFFNDQPIGDVGTWHVLADHFDINGLEDTSQSDEVVTAAQHIYRLSLQQTAVIDFDDMILFPLVKNLRVKFTKDVMFLDEAQDLSRARQALARKFLKHRTGRMIIVGDDRQAIYGFSGADASALSNMIEAYGAKVLPLSVTWRCPRAVVALAQRLVPDIEAAPTAQEGEVLRLTTVPTEFETTDAILCRNTAPLIAIAYRLIRNGHPCKVEGRSIGEGLSKLAGRWKVKTIDALINRLESYQEREIQKAMAKGNDAKAEEVEDRVGTLLEVCTACIAQNKQTVADVQEFITDLFADGAENCTILATYHRAKGREWPRVFLFEHDARCPSKAARQPWQLEQEDNLAYVAFTRAQHTLAFIN